MAAMRDLDWLWGVMPDDEKETHIATENVHVHHRDDKPVPVPAVYTFPPLLHTHTCRQMAAAATGTVPYSPPLQT